MEVLRLLLEAPLASAAALMPNAKGRLPLHCAAIHGTAEAVRLLLEAVPEAALTPFAGGCLALHWAASYGETEMVRLLLETAPEAALRADAGGRLPLHGAAMHGDEERVRLLLEAAPAAALTADARGWLPLHSAARIVIVPMRLLLEAAPEAAMREAHGRLPLEIFLDAAAEAHCNFTYFSHFLENARLLVRATEPEAALSALEKAGELGLPFFADLAACTALSPAQWQRMPDPCPGLAAILPAVLARSPAEAGQLVFCLPARMRRRLRTGALCLGRVQKERHMELPSVLVGQMLALAAGP